VVRQVSLSPVWIGSGSGLREGVEALPPSVTSLALLPYLAASEREGGRGGGAWRLRPGPGLQSSVPAVLEWCAAFDEPGLTCGLVGRLYLRVVPPAAEAGPGALGAYLDQCTELAGRLHSGGTNSGVELALKVVGPAAEAGGAAGNNSEGQFLWPRAGRRAAGCGAAPGQPAAAGGARVMITSARP
jgi:hypothetical protein